MKSTARILATALAAAGVMMAAGAQAATHGGGAHFSGSHFGGGSWHGGGVNVASVRGFGGHGWSGAHFRGWRGPGFGFYFGIPVAWGPYWGYDPFWYGGYYPRETVVYRDVPMEPELIGSPLPDPGAPVPEAAAAVPPSANPAAMHYCASSKAYFPNVKTCPEGWWVKAPSR